MIRDSITFVNQDMETGNKLVTKGNYDVIIKDKKVVAVYNTVFGDWGHSVEKDSMVFEHFSQKYNG